MTKKTNRHIKKKVAYETILEYLALLEENDMNYSQTAKDVKTSRQNIFRWKQKYWEDYLIQKMQVKEKVHEVQAIKLSTVEEFNEIKNELSDLMRISVQKTREILNDPVKFKRMSVQLSNLTQLIKVTAPYCAERVGALGVENTDNITQNHTTFIQNIVEKMSISNYKKLKNDNTEN
jgi:hypothetical protein